MPMDDQDDLDFILEEGEEERKARLESERGGHDRTRSKADDILDAVGGVSTERKDKTKCPLCGGRTKVRAPGVGRGVKQRKCRDCGHLYAVGMVSRHGAIRQLPPAVPAVGPFLGEGGPPIDGNQPIQRRIAEHIRRVRDHEQ
jgi:hypothetical protein